ncbi:hypothetical protein D3C87_706840 [compost metagenome]
MKKFYLLSFFLLSIAISAAADTITSGNTGNWSSGATWIGGIAPKPEDDVIIASGHTVSINASASVKTLTISGTVQFSTGTLDLTVTGGDLIINQTGLLTCGSSGTNTRNVNLKGNLINNGTLTLNLLGSFLKMQAPTVAMATYINGSANATFSSIRNLHIDNASGVILQTNIHVSQSLYLTRGDFDNGNYLTVSTEITDVAKPSNTTISRTALGKLLSPIVNVNPTTLFINYTAQTVTNQITEGYEIPAGRSFARLTVNYEKGLKLNDDIVLTSTSVALDLTNGIVTLAAGKSITINNSTVGIALVSAGNATSFVDGVLMMNLPSSANSAITRYVPLGFNGKSRKMLFTGLNSSTTGTTRHKFYIAQQNSSESGSSLVSAENIRWIVEPVISTTNFTYTKLEIDFNEDDKIGGVNPDIVAKAETLADSYTSLGTGINTANSIVTPENAFTGKGSYLLTKLTVLPVGLLSFEAKKETAGVRLNWTTSKELNNQRFIVEKSTDGKLFKEIQSILGKGTFVGNSSYAILDRNPSNGVNYYRLSQQDFNGITTFLSEKFVRYSFEDDINISVFPNPAVNKINVSLSIDKVKKAEVSLFDMSGKVCYKGKYLNNETLQINVENLKKGAYLLSISGEGYQRNAKVIIK